MTIQKGGGDGMNEERERGEKKKQRLRWQGNGRRQNTPHKNSKLLPSTFGFDWMSSIILEELNIKSFLYHGAVLWDVISKINKMNSIINQPVKQHNFCY
jgi:hypothetical protein